MALSSRCVVIAVLLAAACGGASPAARRGAPTSPDTDPAPLPALGSSFEDPMIDEREHDAHDQHGQHAPGASDAPALDAGVPPDAGERGPAHAH
ncbi:MAG: hypothetical protein M3Y87_20705 [Myxococcota bacterium]|nr:hypothetical protein [Myxococcota bacterium]